MLKTHPPSCAVLCFDRDLRDCPQTSGQVIQLNGMTNAAGARPQIRQLPEMMAGRLRKNWHQDPQQSNQQHEIHLAKFSTPGESICPSAMCTANGFSRCSQRCVAELFSLIMTHGTRSPAPAGHGAGWVERPGRVEVLPAKGRGKSVSPPTISFVVVVCNYLVRLSHRTWQGNFT